MTLLTCSVHYICWYICVPRLASKIINQGLKLVNAGHLLGEEEHGSSFGGIKNKVVMCGPATDLVDSLLNLGIALVDGGRFAVDVERGVVGTLVGFD